MSKETWTFDGRVVIRPDDGVLEHHDVISDDFKDYLTDEDVLGRLENKKVRITLEVLEDEE